TDLPESVPATGFAPYLTGFPLDGTNFYALARTWHATEVPRPGCVWTHTLLIDLADLAGIPDLGTLSILHNRPKRENLAAYESAVRGLPTASFRPTIVSRPLSAELLRGLYKEPTITARV